MDGCKILLDCGWNDGMNVDMLAPLAAIAPSIDAVLVSHPDTLHLGALPYAFGKLGLDCKVGGLYKSHAVDPRFWQSLATIFTLQKRFGSLDTAWFGDSTLGPIRFTKPLLFQMHATCAATGWCTPRCRCIRWG
jgi:hypothetical protein